MPVGQFRGRPLERGQVKPRARERLDERIFANLGRLVAILAVAVVAAIAVALVWYAAYAFTGASVSGSVTSLVNEGQQIAGATSFFRSDHGRNPTSMDELTQRGAYLLKPPAPPAIARSQWTVAPDGRIAYVQLTASNLRLICDQVSHERGYDGSGDVFRTADAADILSAQHSNYGCVGGFFVYALER